MHTELKTFSSLNENLTLIILSYLSCKDLSLFAQVNNFFYKMLNIHFNIAWKHTCNNFFCSSYEKNRIIDIETSNNDNVFSSSFYQTSSIFNFPLKGKFSSIQRYEINNYGTCGSSVNWKQFFSFGVWIRKQWDLYINKCTGDIKNEINDMKDLLYSYLNDFSGFPKLRKESVYVENDINTQLQLSWYDYLDEEEMLYDEYNEILTSNHSNTSLSHYPFSLLINNYILIIRQFQLKPNSYSEFVQLRWYNYLNIDNQPLNNTELWSDNIVVFIWKILIASVKHYCVLSCNYLLHTFNSKNNNQIHNNSNSISVSDEEFLQQYYMRYKNFVDTAVEFNDKYRHINVIVNTIYDNYNNPNKQKKETLPKFSILRLFILIWNNECTLKLSPLITTKINNLFTKVLEEDFGTRNSSWSNTTYAYGDGQINTTDNSFNSWNSTNISIHTMALNTTYHYSTSYYCNGMNINKKPSEDNNVRKLIISNLSSILNDSFCNEYTIFQINLTTLPTNAIYDQLEESLTKCVEDQITNYYITRQKLKQSTHQTIINEILNYFNSSPLFSTLLINKLRLKIFKAVYHQIEKIWIGEILNKFTIEFVNTKVYNDISIKIADNFFEHFANEYENENIYNTLMNSFQVDIPNKIKEYIVVLFFQRYSKENGNLINVYEGVNSWYIGEEGKMMIKNRQVNKEIKKRNINYKEIANNEKVYSLCWNCDLNDVLKLGNNEQEDVVMYN